MNHFSRFLILCAALLATCRTPVSAQELQSQPIPFTVYLDFKTLANHPSASLPIWLESVELIPPATDGTSSTFRLRFRKLPGINDHLLFRLFFNDTKGASPQISAWTELGDLMMPTKKLGTGLGLPTSETLIIPMTGVDSIEVEVPGDGSNVRGAFLSSIKKTEILKAIDFELPGMLADPFQSAQPQQPATNDSYLYGRVKATLDSTTVRLSATDSKSSIIQFELATRPMLALVTFEVLNADLNAPPLLIINRQPLGAVSLHLPDLADPAFQGSLKPLETDMQFRYAGWIKCQKTLPASSLQSGINQLELSDPTGSVAIRSIEVQLKYNWEAFEYTLQP